MKTVVTKLDNILRPLGFSRRKATWNRTTGAYVDVIDVQTSKAGDAVTVNCGVLVPDVYVRCWGGEPPRFVEEAACSVRSRIGQLLDGRDIWWTVGHDRSADEILEKVTAYVLPFLDRMHSPEAIEGFLTSTLVVNQKYPPPIVYLAIIKFDRGDTTGARALLDELHKKTVPAWQRRISEVAQRLGCFGAQGASGT